jgi:hypothetical protein
MASTVLLTLRTAVANTRGMRKGASLVLKKTSFVLALVGLSVAGCSGGGSRGSASVAPASTAPVAQPAPVSSGVVPVTSGVTPVTSAGTVTPVATATNQAPVTSVTIAKVEFDDRDGSGGASKDDVIKITFTGPVTLNSTNARTEIAVGRFGDTLGMGASIATMASDTVAVTLGTDPVLRLHGTYSGVLGNSSGIDVSALGTLRANGARSQGGVDIPQGSLAPGFKPGPSMQVARGLHTATLLNDGRVLIVGGRKVTPATPPKNGTPPLTLENEIYDPRTNVFTLVSDKTLGGDKGYLHYKNGKKLVNAGRIFHTATLLGDGRVLIVGGYGISGINAKTKLPVVSELATAFVFNPKTNKFTETGSLHSARRGHYAVRLPSGDVLVAGGYYSKAESGKPATLDTAEVYDVQTGTFRVVNKAKDLMSKREQGTATQVAGGVFFAGGVADASPMVLAPDTEVYSEQTGTSKKGVGLNENRRWHAATAFSSGNVIITGGDDGTGATDSVAKFVPSQNKSLKIATLKEARSKHAQALIDGTADIALVGGIAIPKGGAGKQPFTRLKTGEWFDGTKNVSETYQLISERVGAQATPLKNGKVLVTGGYTGGATSVNGADGTPVKACEFFQIP